MYRMSDTFGSFVPVLAIETAVDAPRNVDTLPTFRTGASRIALNVRFAISDSKLVL